MTIGTHFTLDELTHSQTAVRKGLSNDPDKTALANLKALVAHILDPLREAVGRPISISSGYRSPRVNKAVGGASSSQHVLGQAADILVPGMTPAQVVAFIREIGLPFDQLIEEPTWTHVSFGPRHRRQVLRARRTAAGMRYDPIE